MQRNKKAKNFLPKPIYQGGNKAIRKFIADTLKYPPEAIEKKIEGVVRVRVAIDYKGKTIDSKVLTHLGYGCDEESERLVKLMTWQIDKKPRKGKILFHKTLNIHFKLPKVKPAAQTPKLAPKVQQIQYNIVAKKPKENKPSPTTTYSYTIKY